MIFDTEPQKWAEIGYYETEMGPTSNENGQNMDKNGENGQNLDKNVA